MMVVSISRTLAANSSWSVLAATVGYPERSIISGSWPAFIRSGIYSKPSGIRVVSTEMRSFLKRGP